MCVYRRYELIAFLFVAVMGFFAVADPGYEHMPADMNLFSHIVIGAAVRCHGRMLRRNGYLYSHVKAFERITDDKDLEGKINHYPDDINCTLNICSGIIPVADSRILVQFPRRIRLACSSDEASCDCLSIYDGPNTDSALLRSYCGHVDRK
ncbi:hypothetical protein NP493_1072g00002 [Ridgeia piscesae]|uniref:Uncharacterized protein n=1 Tax=Ridgeia piscesae TaxID=27915 RepID=A0AAD9KHP3_RIDPI|nr:hypothetical protein NP493_1072g00002 [Ridgeia piscesae]